MRKPRQVQLGAVYHISARINNKEMLLKSKDIKKLFQKVLCRAKKKYNFSVENFVIMGNHFHMLLRPRKGERLSCIMQWIMSVFAMSCNKRLRRTGHVWGERFFSRIMYKLTQYLKVFDYIDNNPFKAGLINKSQIWEYSGKYHYKKTYKRILEEKPVYVILTSMKNEPLLLTY